MFEWRARVPSRCGTERASETCRANSARSPLVRRPVHRRLCVGGNPSSGQLGSSLGTPSACSVRFPFGVPRFRRPSIGAGLRASHGAGFHGVAPVERPSCQADPTDRSGCRAIFAWRMGLFSRSRSHSIFALESCKAAHLHGPTRTYTDAHGLARTTTGGGMRSERRCGVAGYWSAEASTPNDGKNFGCRNFYAGAREKVRRKPRMRA